MNGIEEKERETKLTIVFWCVLLDRGNWIGNLVQPVKMENRIRFSQLKEREEQQ